MPFICNASVRVRSAADSQSGAVVRTLDDAVALISEYKKARWGFVREGSVRRREGARRAANAFRRRVEFEGLIV